MEKLYNVYTHRNTLNYVFSYPKKEERHANAGKAKERKGHGSNKDTNYNCT